MDSGGPGAPACVLVADDDEDLLAVVSKLLERDGHCVLRAASGAEALALAREHSPDLLVLDVSMPGPDGYTVCRELQGDGPGAPPVIFLTARAETQDRVHGLDAGAIDYVVKPFSGAELRARVRAALRTKTASDRLRAEATTDPLTGLGNRGQLGPTIAGLAASARRNERPLACLMIDLDRFKAVNDTYGHVAGDTVLVETAHRLGFAKRSSDVLIRYGGDEFLLLLPETDTLGADVLAEKLRGAVAARPVPVALDGQPAVEIPVQVSVGVSSLDDATPDPGLLVAAADRALYRAKAGGRNRVEGAAAG